MSDYISRDELVNRLKFIPDISGLCLEPVIAMRDIIDIVNSIRPIVKCPECEYADYPGTANPVCSIYYGCGGKGFFCANGKRRED